MHDLPSLGIPSPLASIYEIDKRLKLVVVFNTPGSYVGELALVGILTHVPVIGLDCH